MSDRLAGVPIWFHAIAIASLGLAVTCAAIVLVDVMRRPQRMQIMNVVWPVCTLFGSMGVTWVYFRYGRLSARAAGEHPGRSKPEAVSVLEGALHCGSGCTLGDIVAETVALLVPTVLIAFGWTVLFEDKLWAIWIFDLVLAWLFGIVFQYFTIVPMRHLSLAEGIKAAVKADTLSILSWQVGMYLVMAWAQFKVFPYWIGGRIKADTAEFWFAMQIAMLAGLLTSFPMNRWLINKGWKESM